MDTGSIGASAPAEGTSSDSGQESNQEQPSQGQEQQKAATQTPQEKAAIKAEDAAKLARKFKVKVDGNEAEVDEDELVRSYQLRKVSDKRLQEANQARKQAEEFVNLLRNDPLKVLTDPRIGHDVKKLAEEYLMGELEKDMMTTEQKELKEAKAKLKNYEDWKAEQEKAAIEKQNQELVDRYTQKYQEEIVGALDKSGLPRTESTVNRMINYMAQSLEKGYGLSAEEVVDLVKMDYIRDTKALYAGVPDDILLSILGDDVVRKVVKADLGRVKKNPQATSQKQSFQGKPSEQKSQKIGIDEWKEKLEKIKNGNE